PVRPPDSVPMIDSHQLLLRLFRALLGRKQYGPVLEELVATLLRGPQLAVRRDRHPHGVADSGGVMRSGLLGLVLLRRVESPDARSAGELGARVLAGGLVGAVGDLTHIRRRADIDEQGLAIGRERQVPRIVPAW